MDVTAPAPVVTPVAPVGPTEALLWLPAGRPPALDDLWSRPVGPARVGEAVSRLQAASRADAPAAVERVRSAVRAADPGARVEPVDAMWLDNSVLLRVRGDAERFARLPGGGLEGFASALGGAVTSPSVTFGDAPPTFGTAPAQDAQRAVAPAPGTGTPDGTAAAPVVGPPTGMPWNLEAIGVPAARAKGYTGRGTTIAIVDSGTDWSHPELAKQYRGRREDGSVEHVRSAHDPWSAREGRQPGWKGSHGTFVAGPAVGETTGVAPGASFITARTYGDHYSDTQDAPQADRAKQRYTAVRALQWALAPTDEQGRPDPAAAPQVISGSWGAILDTAKEIRPGYADALSAIAAAGVVPVFAAGNDGAKGAGSLKYPAVLEHVIAAGGTDRAGVRHPDSSFGPSHATQLLKPEVAAPAVDIHAPDAGGGWIDTTPNPGGGFGGTSVATPQVAGALALVNEALARRGEPALDLRDARVALPRLTKDAGAPGPDPETGYGVLDLGRVDEAATAVVSSRRPQAAG